VEKSRFKVRNLRAMGQDLRFKIQDSRLKITPNTQRYAFYECEKGACIIHCLS
jgi:hypothetical protein